ncbi:methylated-DNA--[protein]-cysteine S-methyltransferase [Pelagibacteraceae bacterium]|nr:methylated-DNA--[protein]-cysteine S-methyltransferase [Pelagibacteraceae bacterium]MDC2992149.1 methylated-DNA--[protein]-cysteine S-methyltransferase [Pelagibacteraceae bacterium]
MNSYSFKTIFGWITIKSVKSKLVSVKFGRSKNKISNKYLITISKKIKLFTLGKLKSFKSDYKFSGTPLQIKVWKEISKIKYGQTKSYGEIATKLNTSPRYVGSVCGQNNLLLIIPCHRVVKSDGSLGGFSGLGGIKLKMKLLSLEKKCSKI